MSLRPVLPFLVFLLGNAPSHALSLHGRVTDLEGAPLANVTVELRGPSGPSNTWTDATGAWRMGTTEASREASSIGMAHPGALVVEAGRPALRYDGRTVTGRLAENERRTPGGQAVPVRSAGRTLGAGSDTLVFTWNLAWVGRRILSSLEQGEIGDVRVDTSSRRDSLDLGSTWHLPRLPGRYAYTLFDSSSLEQPSLVLASTEAELLWGGDHDSCRGTLRRLSVDRLSLQDSVRSDSNWTSGSTAWAENLANQFGNPAFGRDTVVVLAGAPRHVRLVGGGYSSTLAGGREALLVVPGWGVVFARARIKVMSGILARQRTLRLRSVDGLALDPAELERLWTALQ